MSVLEALERDLAEIRKRDPLLADSALAAQARSLATELDNASNSATSKSMCARVFMDTMAQLRELAPAVPTKDEIDELSSRRDARRARSART